jgi:hypothetical protein
MPDDERVSNLETLAAGLPRNAQGAALQWLEAARDYPVTVSPTVAHGYLETEPAPRGAVLCDFDKVTPILLPRAQLH